MAFLTEIDDSTRAFIEKQKLFFTATAPVEGRVNISPKGTDSFRVLGPNQVMYLDLTGSGNETAAHLLENPRLTVMFCSFDANPLILRLYGTAESIQAHHPRWDELYGQFPPHAGARQVFLLEVESVQKSCGFGVPTYTYIDDRDTLATWSDKQGKDGVREYWSRKNVESIDGQPTGLVIESE